MSEKFTKTQLFSLMLIKYFLKRKECRGKKKTPPGFLSSAKMAVPPSPVSPDEPVPAMVVMIPVVAPTFLMT